MAISETAKAAGLRRFRIHAIKKHVNDPAALNVLQSPDFVKNFQQSLDRQPQSRQNSKLNNLSIMIRDERIRLANLAEGNVPNKPTPSATKKRLNDRISPKQVTSFDPEILQYPSDANGNISAEKGETQAGHYILFYINSSPGPQASGVSGKTIAAASGTPGSADKKTRREEERDRKNAASRTAGQFGQLTSEQSVTKSEFGRGTRRQRITGQPDGASIGAAANANGAPLYSDFLDKSTRLNTAIALYMPPQVQSTYSLNYTDEASGAFSQGMAEVFKGITAGNADVSGGQITAMALGAASKALDTLAPGAANMVAVKTGRIVNNKMELAFKGVNRREFQFVFTFTPKSREEAKTIDTIVARFKFHSHPDFIDNSKGLMLTIPDTFDIQYMYNNTENSFLNRISTCFLTNTQVQYGGDRFTAHDAAENHQGASGSPPTKTILTMTFKELETLTRKRISEGY